MLLKIRVVMSKLSIDDKRLHAIGQIAMLVLLCYSNHLNMSSLVACPNETDRERNRIIGQARNDLTNEEVFCILIFDT